MDELLDLVIEVAVDAAVDFVLDELFDQGQGGVVHVSFSRLIIVVYIRLVSRGLIVKVMMEFNCIQAYSYDVIWVGLFYMLQID